MSLEKQVRAQQLFRDTLREFIVALECLPTDHLELLMARLIDGVENSSAPSRRADLMFKGKIVHHVYSNRMNGRRKRWNLHWYFWEDAVSADLKYPDQITEENGEVWARRYVGPGLLK